MPDADYPPPLKDLRSAIQHQPDTQQEEDKSPTQGPQGKRRYLQPSNERRHYGHNVKGGDHAAHRCQRLFLTGRPQPHLSEGGALESVNVPCGIVPGRWLSGARRDGG
jgi:hypothetical protein